MPAPLLSQRRLPRPTPTRSARSPLPTAAPPEPAPLPPYCLAQWSRDRTHGSDLNALIARQQQLYDELMASGELPPPATRPQMCAASLADLTRELAGWTPPLPGNCYPPRAPAAASSSATDSPCV